MKVFSLLKSEYIATWKQIFTLSAPMYPYVPFLPTTYLFTSYKPTMRTKRGRTWWKLPSIFSGPSQLFFLLKLGFQSTICL